MANRRSKLIVGSILVLGALASGCSSNANPGTQTSDSASSTLLEKTQPDLFDEALGLAIQASSKSQTATVREDWETVSTLWRQSIGKMSTVPDSSPMYEAAQGKSEEYQRNLAYAKEKAADPFPEVFDLANQALTLASNADTSQDWNSTLALWEKAIDLLKALPESNPHYERAQEKADEYLDNVDSVQARILEQLVSEAATYLTDSASWRDPDQGKKLYDTLKSADGDLVTGALVRQVYQSEQRLQVLFLSVKLGIPGSEEALNEVLLQHGNQSMAEDYLNSGSSALSEGGRRWANAHGYYVATGEGSHRTVWGQF